MNSVNIRRFFGKAWSCRMYKSTSDVTAFVVTLRRSTDLGPCAPGKLECLSGNVMVNKQPLTSLRYVRIMSYRV